MINRIYTWIGRYFLFAIIPYLSQVKPNITFTVITLAYNAVFFTKQLKYIFCNTEKDIQTRIFNTLNKSILQAEFISVAPPFHRYKICLNSYKNCEKNSNFKINWDNIF